MRLDLPQGDKTPSPQQVICDLGCGDGEFLIGLLTHLNRPSLPVHSLTTPIPQPYLSTGFGIDYNATLIATATLNALTSNQPSSWLVYDFNLDADNLFSKIQAKGVTHVFIYLVPKQLELKTVRRLLERLVEEGVCVCCHKFQPAYLEARLRRRDALMDLCVYERDVPTGEDGVEIRKCVE